MCYVPNGGFSTVLYVKFYVTQKFLRLKFEIYVLEAFLKGEKYVNAMLNLQKVLWGSKIGREFTY